MATSAGVGLSTESDTQQAARDAARRALEQSGADRADWGVVFATAAHRPGYASILSEVRSTLGTGEISGCSAAGVLTTGQEVERRPGVAVLAVRSDRFECRAAIATAHDRDGQDAAREIARQIAGAPGAGLAVLLPDASSVRPDTLLQALAGAAPGVEAVGAAASGDPRNGQTFQFCGRNVATRGVAALALTGGLKADINITQGCQPLGEPCIITRGRDNLIMELDGRPALEALRAHLPGSLRDSLDLIAGHLFVGLPPDPAQDRIDPGEYLVRSLIGADKETGALAVGGTVREGQPVAFVLRESQSARDDLKRMLAGLRGRPEDYRFGFYFNCAARGSALYGMPGIDTAYISGALGDLPIVGFFGNGEFAPLRGMNRHFTHTGVLALVKESA